MARLAEEPRRLSRRPLGRAAQRGHGPHTARQAPRCAQRGGPRGEAAPHAPPRRPPRPGPAPSPACSGKRGVARAKAEKGLRDGHGTAEGLQGTAGPERSGATTEPRRAEGPFRGRRLAGGCARCARGSRSCRESGRRERAGPASAAAGAWGRGRSPRLGAAAAEAGRGARSRPCLRAASSGVVPRGAVRGASLALGLEQRAESCPFPLGGARKPASCSPGLAALSASFFLLFLNSRLKKRKTKFVILYCRVLARA